MRRQVTLQDVASAAGVSIQTVSRVINNKPDVAEATRLHIHQAIREVGYRPNRLARSLVSQRSHTIGIISLMLNDLFRAELVTAIAQQARARGYACLLAFSQEDLDDLQLLIDQMMERQVDGMLLLTGKILSTALAPFTVPSISMAYPIQDENVINVDVDNIDGAYQAVSHLTKLGHRSVGFITGPQDWTPTLDRIEDARRALAEIGQPLDDACMVESQTWMLDAGYAAAQTLLSRQQALTALFCHNDCLAVGAYRALAERGLRVPADASVIGYNERSLSSSSR
ncbi:MAG: LacI family DNA-binding transcriptional regulator [Caldilineaceae bacterium]|nr:LacI family DNA-binding transcriptional regulator [Caldilineaceae bacterium]